MDELIEGVLAIGAGLAPDDGSGGVVHSFATFGHTFAVTFHVTLLKIGRKAVHVLVIRQDCLSLCTEEVIVPDT